MYHILVFGGGSNIDPKLRAYGKPVGDPNEANAISRVSSDTRRKDSNFLIGAVDLSFVDNKDRPSARRLQDHPATVSKNPEVHRVGTECLTFTQNRTQTTIELGKHCDTMPSMEDYSHVVFKSGRR